MLIVKADANMDAQLCQREKYTVEISQSVHSLSQTHSQYAVEVKDAIKRYDNLLFWKKNKPTLNRINVNVPHSSVYALLGPSGGGKTTLLKCIIGNLSINSGSIKVFGYAPGTIESGIPGKRLGYMPQDLSLYGDLSIEENLRYYGRLAGMSYDAVKEQTLFLLGLLNLPSKEAKVVNLSGGQKRRVSLAAALLHDPELIIVDEPTVGVDSLLRKRIWNYLYNQATKRNKTIIITTHYVDEARMAGMIGLMHDGTILKEDTPDNLLRKYNSDTLEKVFLMVCLDYEKQDKSSDVSSDLSSDLSNEEVKRKNWTSIDDRASKVLLQQSEHPVQPTPLIISSQSMSMKSMLRNSFPLPRFYRLQAAVTKDFQKSFRDYRIYIALMVGPLILLTLYGLAYSDPPKHLSIAIVNDDEYGLGESFLDCINPQNLKKTYFSKFEDAREAVVEGAAWGVIHVPKNFSHSLMQRLLHGELVDDLTILDSIIGVSLDYTSQPVLLAVHDELSAAFTKFASRTLTRVGLDKSVAELAIRINDTVYSGTSKETFLSFAAPGLAISFVQIVALCLTVMSFFLERIAGQLERSNIAGLTSVETALSFAISSCALILVPTAVVILVLFTFFNVTCRGSFILFATLLYLQGLSGMTFGLLTSAVCSSEFTAVMFAFGGNLPNLVLSGVFWPIQGMPWILQYVTVCLPNTYAIIGLRDIMSRGWTIAYFSVYMGFTVSTIWILTFFFASAIVLRFKS